MSDETETDIELLRHASGQRLLRLNTERVHILLKLSDDDVEELRTCVNAAPKPADNDDLLDDEY